MKAVVHKRFCDRRSYIILRRNKTTQENREFTIIKNMMYQSVKENVKCAISLKISGGTPLPLEKLVRGHRSPCTTPLTSLLPIVSSQITVSIHSNDIRIDYTYVTGNCNLAPFSKSDQTKPEYEPRSRGAIVSLRKCHPKFSIERCRIIYFDKGGPDHFSKVVQSDQTGPFLKPWRRRCKAIYT